MDGWMDDWMDVVVVVDDDDDDDDVVVVVVVHLGTLMMKGMSN